MDLEKNELLAEVLEINCLLWRQEESMDPYPINLVGSDELKVDWLCCSFKLD